jgi:hypothetical protein
VVFSSTNSTISPPRPTSSGHPSLKKGGEITETIYQIFNSKGLKLMKQLLILLAFFTISCNKKTTESTAVTGDDKEQIQSLIRKTYEWHETKSTKIDFSPKETTDSMYAELDLIQHQKSLKELTDSGFFTENFLKNYDTIAQKANADLKSKSVQWYVGEIPSFGNDTYTWCGCQDYPDECWKKLTLKNLVFDKETATFSWTWGDNFEYRAKAQKVNDSWKIDYLQGFDFDDFFNQE